MNLHPKKRKFFRTAADNIEGDCLEMKKRNLYNKLYADHSNFKHELVHYKDVYDAYVSSEVPNIIKEILSDFEDFWEDYEKIINNKSPEEIIEMLEKYYRDCFKTLDALRRMSQSEFDSMLSDPKHPLNPSNRSNLLSPFYNK